MTSEGGAPRAPHPMPAAAVHSTARGPQRDSPLVGMSCIRCCLSSAALGRVGVRPELPASLRLQIPHPQFPAKIPVGRQPDALASPLGDQPRPAPLPVRSPGMHLHPLLRRPPVASSGSVRGENH